jgi:hypothetical protein
MSALTGNETVLPDSRARQTRGRIFTNAGVYVPIFCANCGVESGSCPEENMSFLFYLCQKCFETHGHITGLMVMPDEVFFQKLKDEQLASYGHYLTQDELKAVVEEDASPLATLLKDAR